MKDQAVINVQNFIRATRDSGYKNASSSLAELIDNSLEARAENINIELLNWQGEKRVVVSDDGIGMAPKELRLALQFGGSTRFDSRHGSGRYGMGLPNSSLSRARRLDIYTWRKPQVIWHTYLDVDEIAHGRTSIPQPKRVSAGSLPVQRSSASGTIVMWSKCDRLGGKFEKNLIQNLHRDLGQIFRKRIWNGILIKINTERVCPFDPLFLRKGSNLVGAEPYGEPLRYELRVSDINGEQKLSTIVVSFSELPIEEWHFYSNDEKRKYGISKSAGVSILRADREIDYGWFFMGSKRKENYDDWWRCEIRFEPDLDELFGVTHTKQDIRPTQTLRTMLSPDVERIAHVLNGRVRRRYSRVRSSVHGLGAPRIAEARDSLLEPLPRPTVLQKNASRNQEKSTPIAVRKGVFGGLVYRIEHKPLDEPSFYIPVRCSNQLVVMLNEEHPFFEHVYSQRKKAFHNERAATHRYIELMLFAAARAECSITSPEQLSCLQGMRELWSKTLAAFLD